MFFGIGRRAVEEFGKEMVGIIPDLSSIQQAFARICEPWDNAFLMSMHGGPDPNCRRKLEYGLSDIPSLLAEHKKLAVLTDDINNPTVIATVLADGAGSSDIIIHVCEKLGYPDEKITTGTPQEIMGKSYSEPNVVIVKRSADPLNLSPSHLFEFKAYRNSRCHRYASRRDSPFAGGITG
jgi:precorrin-6Y C5,15-methyltransferase (decarboxylating)